MRFIQADTIYPVSSKPIKNGIVVVNNFGKIEDVLDNKDEIDESKIEKHRGSICPGFVNAHCHLELSHLKDSIPEKTGIVDFAHEIILKRNSFSRELIEEAVAKADVEMERKGIVAVGDICNDDITINTKTKSNIHYSSFIELIGFNPANAQKTYETGVELREKFWDQHLVATLVPHAPYSVSMELMKLIREANDGKAISIHNQESREENEFFEKGTGNFVELYKFLGLSIDYFKPAGKSSLRSYLKDLVSEKNLVLVHNTFSGEEDILFGEKTSANLFWCLCPNANLYIENRLPELPLLVRNNCKIVIGTDSLASNHQLDIMNELGVLRKNFPALTTWQLLQWATLNGAQFLGIDDQFGSIEKGKKPGLVLMEETEEGFEVRGLL